MAGQIIQLETAQMDMTPYYMATLASDIFGAAKVITHPPCVKARTVIHDLDESRRA